MDNLLKRAAHFASIEERVDLNEWRGKKDRICFNTAEKLQAFLDSETKELQRQVAMLHRALLVANDYMPTEPVRAEKTQRDIATVNEALNATTETAKAYENKVKAEALEEAAKYFHPECVDSYGKFDSVLDDIEIAYKVETELRRMASSLNQLKEVNDGKNYSPHYK